MNQLVKSHITSFITALALLMLPLTSQAVDFHVGFGLGSATIEENLGFDDGSLYNIDYDEDTLALTVYGELQFNRLIRMEFGILDGGLATMDADSVGGSFWWPGPVEVEYGLGGIKFGVVASIPLAPRDRVKLLLKTGMIAWGSVVTLSDSWGDIDDNDAGVDPYYGIGLEFDLSRLLALRLQHEKFSVDAHSDVFVGGYEFDYQNTTVGLVFRF
ncbi:MAG: outer membrane beta-barrel protein [Proteobacteria bacterium]|nr:outer membrane beta-barrel protein [Pseudomonadota bacterium]